jgi:membrane protein DedA with SNARE-associated domain
MVHLSYLGIFLWFALLEQFTPIPEETSLMVLGYAYSHMELNPVVCGLAAISGLITADNIFFRLSKIGNHLAQKALKHIHLQKIENLKARFRQKPVKTMLAISALPKIRFLSPIIAASAGIPWKKFFIVNTIAILIYASFYMYMGLIFQTQLKKIFAELENPRHLIFILLMLVFTVILLQIKRLHSQMRN